MNKKLRIIGASVGVAILIIGIAVFVASRKESTQSTVNQPLPTVMQDQTNSSTGGKSTYQEFVESGRSEVCHFASNVDGNLTTGTVYAAYGKLRTDFVITYPKGTVNQHLVVDSYLAYVWSNASSIGIKFAVDEGSGDSALNDSFGRNAGYQCKDQRVDPAVFDLPNDVAFTDITGLK